MNRHSLGWLYALALVGFLAAGYFIGNRTAPIEEAERTELPPRLGDYPDELTGLPVTILVKAEPDALIRVHNVCSKLDLPVTKIDRRAGTMIIDRVHPEHFQIITKVQGVLAVVGLPSGHDLEPDVDTARNLQPPLRDEG